MADKILLCISATQAVVAHQRGRGLVRCEIFGSNEEGMAAFDAFLGDVGMALVYVTVDSVEEDYRYETLPHASGSDRAGMLGRKFKQYYRNSPYATAISRGRTADKRRDDRYLFAALTNPALVDPWLATVAKHGLPVAGIYLASMLTAPLLKKAGHDLAHVLVAAPHGSGLRLTFFKDGDFCISRLSRGAAGSDVARAYATEISNTRLYLSSLHLDSLDDPLKVLLLDRDDSLAPVAEHLSAELPNIECVRIGRDALINQLRVAPEHLDVSLETVYLALLADKVPEVNLAPATVTSGHRQYQRRIAIHAASALVAVAGILWAAHNLWQAHDLGEQTTQAVQRTSEAQSQYSELTREFPAAPTTSDNLIAGVELYKKVVKTIRSPQPFMQFVSRAVEATPEIFLQEINWTYGTEVVSPDGSPRTPQAGAAPEATGTLRQSGYVTGEVRPFQGDYRAAIDAINGFAKRLADNPAVADVRVVKYPLNVNPGLSLAGNTRDAAEHAGVADFKILLTLKPDA